MVGHLLANLALTAVLLKVSYHNYPGGHALHHLNTRVPSHTGTIKCGTYARYRTLVSLCQEKLGYSVVHKGGGLVGDCLVSIEAV